MNRKAFIRKFAVGVFASAMLIEGLKNVIPYPHIPPPPPLNVMLVSPGKPPRYYATVLEAYKNVDAPFKDNEMILASGFRWVI